MTVSRTVLDGAPGVRVMTNETAWVSGPNGVTCPCWTGPRPSTTTVAVSKQVQVIAWTSFWVPGLVPTETVARSWPPPIFTTETFTFGRGAHCSSWSSLMTRTAAGLTPL